LCIVSDGWSHQKLQYTRYLAVSLKKKWRHFFFMGKPIESKTVWRQWIFSPTKEILIPGIRLKIKIRDGRRVSVADTRQRVRMAPFPQIAGGYPGIPKDTCGQKGRWPAATLGHYFTLRYPGPPSSVALPLAAALRYRY
jgi:hypothetical protein